MAVTISNTTLTAGAGSVGPRVLLHTATADACLLVWTHSNESVSCSAVAAGGVAMTRLGVVNAGTSRAELWGLTSVASGILTISAVQVGVNVATWNLIATSYVGHKVTGGGVFGTVVAGTATAANAVFSVSSTTSDLIAFGFGISANTTVTLTTGTLRADATHSTTGRLVVGDITGAPTVSISATAAASGVWSFLAVPLVAVPAVSTLQDTFPSGAVDDTKWGITNTNGTATCAAGVVELTFLTAGGFNDITVVSDADFNLLGSSVFVRLVNPLRVAGDTNAAGTYFLLENFGPDRLMWVFGSNNTVWVSKADNATEVTLSTITTNYSASASDYAWLRIAESAGNVLFDRAPLSSSNPPISSDWVNAHTVALSTLPNNFAYCKIKLNVFMYSGQTVTQPARFDGLNTSANSSASYITGNFSATGAADTFSATGQTLVRGLTNATEAPDRFSLTAAVIVRGTFTATNAADTFSAPAGVRVFGRLSATDVADTYIATGQVKATSRLSATDAPDTFAATSKVIVRGLLAATDAPDTFSASGLVLGGALTGTIAATDSRDTFAATAQARISGTISNTNAPDTLAATGRVIVTGNFAATDVPDTFAATLFHAGAPSTGTFAATDAPDTFAASGTSTSLLVTGTFTATETPDTFYALVNNVSASAAPVTILQDRGSGGGGSKKKRPYVRSPDDFWELREQHLKSLHPELREPEPAPAAKVNQAQPTLLSPKALQTYRIQRAQVIEALPKATSLPQLKSHGRRLAKLNRHIAEQKHLQLLAKQQEALRLKQEAERKKRLRKRKLKKAIKLLTIARALSTLTYLYGKL